MNLRDLQLFKESALTEFKTFKRGCRLNGMKRELTEGEMIALAYYIVATKTNINVTYPDSECETDD